MKVITLAILCAFFFHHVDSFNIQSGTQRSLPLGSSSLERSKSHSSVGIDRRSRPIKLMSMSDTALSFPTARNDDVFNWLTKAKNNLISTTAYLRWNIHTAVMPFFLSGKVSYALIANSFAYFVGFETWNQFNSEEEDALNGKQRPIPDKRLTIPLWILSLVIATDWSVRVWLLLAPIVYVAIGNHTPFKELYMMWGVFTHFRMIGLPIDIMKIVRFGTLISVQDVRDVEGDKKSGRYTIANLIGSYFPWFYAICAIGFYFIDKTMPIYSLITYLVISVLSLKYPKLMYELFAMTYFVEVFLSCRGILPLHRPI